MCAITGCILYIATGFQLSSICHISMATPNTAAIMHMMSNNDIMDIFFSSRIHYTVRSLQQ